uniref:cytochrome P450 n=1 Tax=Herbidospora sakaeratensis TaxID=564415 RepID=UPI000784B8AD|nr:cytochrome P450 [Herbidospora sakaeratensis]
MRIPRADPHPVLRRMREQTPVVQIDGAWYLTRYADVQRALLDPAVGRRVVVHEGVDDPLAMVRRTMFNLDPPDHTRLRRLMAPAFGPRTVARLDRRIGEITAELVAGLDGEADVIEQLALPLPILVMADLIGFPAADAARLRVWSDAMLRSHHAPRIRAAGLAFVRYIEKRVAERREQPRDDLLTRLAFSAELDQEELVAGVFQLVMAGDETTVNLIGNGVLELLRHPAELARLRRDPGLIDSAVEEVMRFNGPVGHSRPLYALADVAFGDVVIPEGDRIVPVLLAANRDPEVFPDPDVFDVGRTPNRHLGLGHGIHFCLGAALGRLQARAAIGALIRRPLEFAADPAGLEWTPDLFIHGVRRLPLRVGP